VALAVAPAERDVEDVPWMYQGGGELLGPMDDIVLAHEAWGIDCEAGLSAIVDDLPMGATPDEAYGRIRLLMLANHVSLRQLESVERARGVGFLQSQPATAFSPVAVTPDELGEAWRGGKVHLPLRSARNGDAGGQPDAAEAMAFSFPQLLAHLCRTRRVGAGTIVGSEPVLPKSDAVSEPGRPLMRFGDTVRIEMLDARGKSVFGAIEQVLRHL
jgi:fumarylacetoacetate (FAA) hydrolase